MYKFFIFSFLLATPIVIFEILLQNIPNNYSYKNDYLAAHGDEIEVLIFGNSHSYSGILANQMESHAFNAGYVSQSLDLDLQIFDKFKEELSALDVVVINISYHSFFNSLAESKVSWRIKNYNLYYDFNIGQKPSNYCEVLGGQTTRLLKRVKYYYYNDFDLVSCDVKGSEPFINEKKKRDVVAHKFRNHKSQESAAYYTKVRKELTKLVAYAKERDVQVVFSIGPTTREYQSQLDAVQLKAMYDVMTTITTEYDNTYVFDYLKSDLFEPSDFYDFDHLNAKGAKKFTFLLNEYVKGLEK